MMVYVLAGLHTTKVAVDFMLGSGWRRKISCKNPEITKTLESEVEDALLSAASYKGHFGPDDHDYSHWMALELPHGSYALRVLLFIRPAAASKARRDATPLRLISWLSYKLNPELEHFIEKAMEHLSTWTETEGGKVLTMGKEANS